jgi:hypothetical protein
MQKVTKRYLRFYYPGLIFSDSSDVEVEYDFPQTAVWPKNAFAYRRVTRSDIIECSETFRGKEETGPLVYHPDSKLESLEQVRLNPKATECLISNMEVNGWNKIVWTIFNQAMPLNEGDCIEGRT